MAEQSSIEWTDATWNPTTGCTKISPGCDNCYAERIAERIILDDYDPVGIYPQLDGLSDVPAIDTIAVAIKTDQTAGTDPGRLFSISVKKRRQTEQIRFFRLKNLKDRLVRYLQMLMRLGPTDTKCL